jgi:hypothetical protein
MKAASTEMNASMNHPMAFKRPATVQIQAAIA